ncbi:hypothetical protein RHSIM_Rhsim01G0136400 [Rhododendron simsii]|uniref:Glycosyltransferase n=1 Tax=Rhododendron simsii TaxID=118357 RepID=A0A834L417_RHOSS|nr:hypothetical protein RHSIM_RhsimUnG0213600 [Rhododendron simsii]KAF7152094.1 hypothetical protein RHSIM_Rhsim01G0136400 [Rhododendron simsii]
MDHIHILLVTFPGQGLINPSLQFAKRLVRMGIKVTFVTSFSALNSMTKTIPTPEGLTIAGFSDGYNVEPVGHERGHFMAELRRLGSKAITELIIDSADKGQPFSRVVYTTLVPWVGEVARKLHFPSTFLWVQPAMILDIYYFYFNGYGDAIRNNRKDLSWSIELPGLPRLSIIDLPSFVIPSDAANISLLLQKQHIEILAEEKNPTVLINSFDALEPEALRAVEKFNMVAIGPLVPSAFLDEKEPSDTSFGGDIFENSSGCIEWLNSKEGGSVVYVAFGSICLLSQQQMEEIAHGLQESHRPFLWVIRATTSGEKEVDKLSCKEELEQLGMIVPWCSQVEVLSHPSLGCFVSHCGWNSSLESLVSGVPVVAFPLWSDQGTNAKLIKDVWQTGVRVTANKEGLVEGEEIKRCIEIVMGGGDRAEEMRRNARKWRDLARVAAKEGGSSDTNLKNFLNEV